MSSGARRIGRRSAPIRTHGTAPPPTPLPPSAWVLPDPRTADADGVVGVGADLAAPTLVDAYRRGIFPWPHENLPLPWFSPDPRGVLEPGDFHISRSLRRRLRNCRWATSVDRAFDEVVAACGHLRLSEGTWITPAMRAAYLRLHDLGWAHSVEVWDQGDLIGGIYGVQVGGVFTGESMFHAVTDASKVALLALCDRFAEAGGAIVDVQITTAHLASLGAVDWDRERYLATLQAVRDHDIRLALDPRPVYELA